MSARAAGFLAQRSIVPGRRVVVCRAPGSDGVFAEGFARTVRERGLECEVTVVEGVPVAARGTSRVKEVSVREGGTVRAISADAFVIDAARAPAYELAEQAGATVAFAEGAFRIVAPQGKVRDGVHVAGELAGVAFEPRELAQSSERTAG